MKDLFIAFFVCQRSQIWGNFEMNKELKDQTPSNNLIESDTFDRLHTKKDEYVVDDYDYDLGSSSTQERQQQMSQSFFWSRRNVAILASLCVVTVLSFAAFSMIAPFYPHEVSLIIGEQFIV